LVIFDKQINCYVLNKSIAVSKLTTQVFIQKFSFLIIKLENLKDQLKAVSFLKIDLLAYFRAVSFS